MIQLDDDFEKVEAKEGGAFEPPEPGGYVMTVLDISEAPSKAGNAMVTLSLDISEGENAGCFQKFPKKFFQQVNGDNLPYFKAMIQHFQASNPADKMNQVIQRQRDQSIVFNGAALKGMRIGANLREAEYMDKTGNLCVGIEVGALCAVKDIALVRPMPLKKLKGAKPAATRQPAYPTTGAPPLAEDDLPF